MNEATKKRIADISSGIIPEGYKKTKVGIVPVEWENKKFSDIFTEKSIRTSDFEKYPLYSLTIEEGVVPKSERYERSHLVKKDDLFKVVSENDYVYNPMNVRFGALARYKGKNPVSISGYYDIFSVNENYSMVYMDNFLLSAPMINYYNSVSTGSLKEKQRVHFSQFIEFNLPIPSLPEQKKIAEILSTQDKLIELQEKKIEKLKELKKAYLQKMFPKKGCKYPELRFKGFTDAWEQRKLSEISDKVSKKNQNMVVDEVFTNSAEYGIISQRDYFDKDIANSENIDGYYIVEPNDFVYNPRISTLAPFGPIRRNKLEKSGAMSPLYYVFRTHDVDYGFLEYYFKTNGWHSFMHLNGNSGARSDRFAIRDEIFKEMPITMPQDIDEQKRIGDFFTTLEMAVTLHQRKSEQEKQKKKALMQLLLTGKVRVIP